MKIYVRDRGHQSGAVNTSERGRRVQSFASFGRPGYGGRHRRRKGSQHTHTDRRREKENEQGG